MGGAEIALSRWLSACCIGSDGEHLADRISYVYRPSYAGHESANQLTSESVEGWHPFSKAREMHAAPLQPVRGTSTANVDAHIQLTEHIGEVERASTSLRWVSRESNFRESDR